MADGYRSFPSGGGGGWGKTTQTAATKINRCIWPKRGYFSRLNQVVYTAQGTAHVLTVMRSLGRCKTTADAAASQAVINIDVNPGSAISNALAGSDYVAYRNDANGVIYLDTVSSISSLAVTLTTSLAAALASGADLWMFGVAADTDPILGEAHGSLRGVASTTSTYSQDLYGLFVSHNPDEPVLFQSDNATAAGTLEQLSYSFTSYGGR